MDLRALLLTALLLPLAGCLSDDAPVTAEADVELAGLSEPIHDIGPHSEAHFVGSLGVQLYLDWIVPEGPGPWPTILGFTPYQGADPVDSGDGEGDDGSPGAPYSQSLVDRYVPRGYAVAFADVRGNHEAGGCIDQSGPDQWQDGYDYVQWIAEQPWSDGNVGMWGASYVGETQITTAILAPPALKTIVPVASVSNQYDWNFYNGVPYLTQPTLGMVAYLQGSAVPSSDPNNAFLLPEKLECQDEAMLAGIDYSGDNSTFWQERDYRFAGPLIDIPVLHIHGLRDWNVRPVHIDPLFNGFAGEKRGIFGQWGHAYPDRPDWEGIEIAWYDHHLKGLANGIMETLPPVLIEDDQDTWWGIDSFPPLDQEWLTLALAADGSLVVGNETEPGTAAIVDASFMVDSGAFFDFRVEEELRLVGTPRIEFTAATMGVNTHWVANLDVVGYACDGQSICQNAGFQDTRHRDGMEAPPSDINPGEPYRLDFTMYPQYDVIPAGSVLRLSLTVDDIEIRRDTPTGGSTVYLGGDEPALLHLPLAPAQVSFPEEGLVEGPGEE